MRIWSDMRSSAEENVCLTFTPILAPFSAGRCSIDARGTPPGIDPCNFGTGAPPDLARDLSHDRKADALRNLTVYTHGDDKESLLLAGKRRDVA